MRAFAIPMVLLVFLATLSPAHAFAESQAPSMAPSELSARRVAGTAPMVIDVRTAEEYATSHNPGVLNIPIDQVAKRISEVDAPNGVALDCMLGPRARKGET